VLSVHVELVLLGVFQVPVYPAYPQVLLQGPVCIECPLGCCFKCHCRPAVASVGRCPCTVAATTVILPLLPWALMLQPLHHYRCSGCCCCRAAVYCATDASVDTLHLCCCSSAADTAAAAATTTECPAAAYSNHASSLNPPYKQVLVSITRTVGPKTFKDLSMNDNMACIRSTLVYAASAASLDAPKVVHHRSRTTAHLWE
jgi:hypothetical protein